MSDLFDDSVYENIAAADEAAAAESAQAEQESAARVESTVVEFLTGAAGTGKTFTLRQRMKENQRYGVLAATTGVAAVNLDTVTVNSLLGFFDTESLKDAYTQGWLHLRLRRIREEHGGWLWIDEISMMHKEQLDLIHMALDELNSNWLDERKPTLALGLTGDFCQLPPVKGDWVFNSDCWPKFAANTTRLTKVWRQADEKFLEAINLARSGNGAASVAIMKQLGTQFVNMLDLNFDGTTIVAKNEVVDRFNAQRLASLTTLPFKVTSTRWGKQRSEWKQIPETLTLKQGALVMILVNDTPDFNYVNGDLAIVEEHADEQQTEFTHYPETVTVRTKRTGGVYALQRITRCVESRERPAEGTAIWEPASGKPHRGEPYYSEERKRWIYGAISYFPLRLGWCTTVHKSQGLSLDRVQIDCRDGFFGFPNMAYVALSRARSIEGMRIVGAPDTLARRIKLDPRVRAWI